MKEDGRLSDSYQLWPAVKMNWIITDSMKVFTVAIGLIPFFPFFSKIYFWTINHQMVTAWVKFDAMKFFNETLMVAI